MIPIILKDFQWSQNESWVFVGVSIPKVKTGSVDIITSPKYLKVYSAPGFIFEVFLAHEVDDTLGECTIDEKFEKVSFRLKKLEGGGCELWEDLEATSLSKEDKLKIRKEAVEITQQRHQRAQEEKQKRRFDRKQATVHDQIRLDTEAKQRITSVKNFESSQALLSLQSPPEIEDEKQIFTEEDDITATIKAYQEEIQKKKEEAYTEAVGIRPCVSIPVTFTPRVFPTPSRESTHADEQEWLKKQLEARKLCGFVDEDLRPEERNPEWLLDKGLSLMRTGSYLGAISAFSLGVRLAPKMPELLVERAGAHLAVENYHRTVEDSTQALEMLTPKVSGNLMDRLKCHVRRAAAFRALDMWEEAISDFKDAERLAEETDGSVPKNLEEFSSLRGEIKMGLTALPKEMTTSGNSLKIKGKPEKGDGDSLKSIEDDG